MTELAYLYPDWSLGLAASVFPVTPSGLDIGRHPECGLPLPVDSVSRRHAHLELTAGQWILTDLESSNGTFVNGERIKQSRALADGDVITLGKATFTFRFEPVEETAGEADEHTSGLRLVGDEEDASVILSTRLSDRTPFKTGTIDASAEAHLDRINQRLAALYRLSDELRGASRRDSIIASLMELIFENLPADRGVALRISDVDGELKPELYRFRDGVSNREFVLSRAITSRAIGERVAVLSRDVHTDTRFQSSESMMASDIRSAMCVPLAGQRSLMGLLFLDTKESAYAFTEDDLAFVSALATDAAMTLENLSLVEENIRQERLAAVGQTISGLAHNIKNILQLARGGTELMDIAIQKRNLEEIKTLWPITRRSIERMQALTQEMLDFSRQSKPEVAPGDVNQVVKQLAELVRGDKHSHGIKMNLRLDESCGHPLINEDVLCKALMNLLSNAIDALHGKSGAEIDIETENLHDHVLLRVKDNGPGIPNDIKAKIFQPFFSTKGSKGNGLGLSMTRKYLEDMNAHLDLISAPGQGCEFLISLPVAEKS